MAAKKSSTKKTTTKKKTTSKKTKKKLSFYEKNKFAIMISYIIAAILFIAIAVIPGASFWAVIKGAFFAVFGSGFAVLTIAMIVIALRIAGDNLSKSLLSTSLNAVGIAITFSTLIHIFTNSALDFVAADWWEQILNSTLISYEIGTGIFGIMSGFTGAFFGASLLFTITKIPAIIICIIALALFCVGFSNYGFNYFGMKFAHRFQNNQAKKIETRQIKKEEKEIRIAKNEAKLQAQREAMSTYTNNGIGGVSAPILSKTKPKAVEFEPIDTDENIHETSFAQKSEPVKRPAFGFGANKKTKTPDINIAPDENVDVAAQRAKIYYPEIDGSFEELDSETPVNKDDYTLPMHEPIVKPENPENDPNYRPLVNPFVQQKAASAQQASAVQTEKPNVREFANDEQAIIDNAVKTAEAHAQKSFEDIDNSKSETKLRKKYSLPPLECLTPPKFEQNQDYTSEIKLTAKKLVETLKNFNVETKLIGVSRGPTVTRYELQPAKGVKISRITNLADDIALSLASSGVRIEAPIPNKPAVGIEVPNKMKSNVTFREMISSSEFKAGKSKINVVLGKDISGENICADLGKMPHLLIAGTTGSGKSVCLNSMITSILFNATCEEVKLLMIDPKQVEFSVYNGIPHLLVPVISDPRKAGGSLAWAVGEMENRYKMFSTYSVRDIGGFNKMAMKNPEVQYMPQIVIFIDELNDLMMLSPKEVENSICRLAQKARAAGMHLVVATQRPSVDVITGLIKANIPSRISLSVSSQVDSRTILDSYGAEKLLGNGDMLYYPTGYPKPVRIQGAYLSDEEIQDVVAFLKEQDEAHYDEEIMSEIEKNSVVEKGNKTVGSAGNSANESSLDPLFERALELVVENQTASTSLLQRHLQVGFARAARITDQLYENGMIGPPGGAKGRKVLITPDQLLEMKVVNAAVDEELN